MDNDNPYPSLPPELMPASGMSVEDFDADDYDAATLDDDRQAEWCLRNLRRDYDRATDQELERAAYSEQIETWHANLMWPIRRRIGRLEDTLKRYALASRSRTGRKTLKLPSGTLRTQEAKEPTIEVTDEKLALAWAENLDAEDYERCVRAEPHLLISEVRKLGCLHVVSDSNGDLGVVDDDGQFVDGFAVKLPEATATIQL